MNRKFGYKWENGLEVLKKYKYSLCVLILAFLFNEFVYYLARYINLNRMHYNLTLSFDNEIPVIIFWVFSILDNQLFYLFQTIQKKQ